MARYRKQAIVAMSRRRRPRLECLESRQLLASLVGHWAASDLDATHDDGDTINNWPDSVDSVLAAGEGSPRLIKNALKGQSIVRFDPSNDGDSFFVDGAESPFSGVDDFSIATVFTSTQTSDPVALFQEDFSGFTAPPQNFNGGQYQSGFPVAFSGDLPDWSKSGGGTVHVVENVDQTVQDRDFAVMIWQDNVITLNSPISGSNQNGETYTIDFVASPAVYQAASQQTGPNDGILIEVLRDDDSVLASHTYLPGAWSGDINLVAESFDYEGDGSEDIHLRVGPSNFNSGRFGGAIDDLMLRDENDLLFSESFDAFTAPPGNFNGNQFESGLPVAHTGNLPDWSKTGGGTVHVVDHFDAAPAPRDFSVMIWQDNVITLDTPINGSNTTGETYLVDFVASPAVYQIASQQTGPNDGILIEVLRGDNSVLANHTYLPGPWAGNIVLTADSFEYVGDGTGNVRLRVGPSNFNSGRFGGAIDDLTLKIAQAIADGTGAWFDHLGLIDASQSGTTSDWGVSMTRNGQVAVGVGNPESTLFSTSAGLTDGEPHAVIYTKNGETLTLSVDGVVETLNGASASTRATLDFAIGRLWDGSHFFNGDIAEIRLYDGALTEAEVTTLNQQLLDTYQNEPPVAADDNYQTQEDAPLNVPASTGVINNDTDAEGRALFAMIVDPPTEGSVSLNTDGSFTYQPRQHFFGTDAFTYLADDGEKQSNLATVTINVSAVADAPRTLADTYLLPPDITTTIGAARGVLANDFHPDGLTFHAVRVRNVQHGNLAFQSDGSFAYTPEAGFAGTDTFTYTADDTILQSPETEVSLVVSSEPIVISEFAVSNDRSLPTRTRSSTGAPFAGGSLFYDWIELHNLASVPADIGGLHLTDREGNPTKWEFPIGTTIPSSDYLVVFASGLNITDPSLDERGFLHTDFQLDASGEYLGLTSRDGAVVHQYWYPGQFTNVSYGVTDDPSPGYFLSPTPGAANAAQVSTNGPIVTNVTENPGAIGDDEDLVVTANIQQRNSPIDSVELVYRTMFQAEQGIAMRDNGTGGDQIAGDGVYSATIPHAAASAGEMLRWKVIATDQQQKETSAPLNLDRVGERQSPEYFGTMIANPAVDSQLPVLDWCVQSPGAATTVSGTRASVFFDGEFHDNVFVRSRGASAQSVVKKSFKFEFNVGHDFLYSRDDPRVTEINVNTTFQDKAYIRPQLTFESYQDAGVVASDSFTWRIEQNGQFHSVASFVEQVDDDLLSKNGLDPNGALYKMFNGVTSSTSGVEKKSRLNENHSDLQDLVNGISPGNPDRDTYLFDNIDIPAMINYATAGIISQDFDRWAKNFYLYRDSDGTGEWLQIPHDKDLTFGNRFFDDEISGDGFSVEAGLPPQQRRAHPFQAAAKHACCGQPNLMIDALVENPRTREMYLRRLRTLMDQQLQPPGTPADQLRFETRIDELAAAIAPDATADLSKWGAIYGAIRNFPTAIQLLKTNYLNERRIYLYETHSIDNPAVGDDIVGIPHAQLGSPTILFGAVNEDNSEDYGEIVFNPISGNQDEEYISLINPNAEAVDISGWELTGAVRHTFAAGTVIPFGDTLYVSPNLVAFRARNSGPSSGQGLFVQGNYGGHLSNFGETLTLLDSAGNIVSTLTYDGDPSDLQEHLRFSEINYNPYAPSADELLVRPNLDNDQFEFVEIINTGPSALDLSGVQLTQGVRYTFANGTSLDAGQRILVVKDRAAFELRYGSELNVAGEFASGSLSNGGEALKLEDPTFSTISEFTYRDSDPWSTLADGRGATLEAVDPSGDLGSGSNWRPSTEFHGSPGLDGVGPIDSIVINEVLAHTDLPATDSIELYNPTAADIDLSGWFLSDSSADYLKYEFPDGTILTSGTYLVLDESDFNASIGVDPKDFALDSAHGDQLYLLEATQDDHLVKFIDFVRFGATANGESIGLWPNGQGELVPMTSNTFGASNSGARFGPILINEVQYHPLDPGPGFNLDDLEYVEILNPTDAPVDLTDWMLNGGIEYAFADGQLLEPGELLVVVSFDPLEAANAQLVDDFRTYYGIDDSIRLVGNYSGRLGNSGDIVQLLRPDAPPLNEPNFIPLLLEDQIEYSDLAPWPTLADGQGASLRRSIPAQWGNDPANWLADGPTPGSLDSNPVVTGVMVNGGIANPADLDKGPAPSNWQLQRSSVRTIQVAFSEPVVADHADFVLTNLGADADNDPDNVIALDARHVVMDGLHITLTFAEGELSDGAYKLEILSSVADLFGQVLDGDSDGNPGGSFLMVGSISNGLFQRTADFNGDAGVSIFDFPTFSYWFGTGVGTAPEYVDLNADKGISIFDFPVFASQFGSGIRFHVVLTGLIGFRPGVSERDPLDESTLNVLENATIPMTPLESVLPRRVAFDSELPEIKRFEETTLEDILALIAEDVGGASCRPGVNSGNRT